MACRFGKRLVKEKHMWCLKKNMSVLAEMQVPRLLQVMCFPFSPWQRLSTPVSQATDANNESSVLRPQVRGRVQITDQEAL